MISDFATRSNKLHIAWNFLYHSFLDNGKKVKNSHFLSGYSNYGLTKIAYTDLKVQFIAKCARIEKYVKINFKTVKDWHFLLILTSKFTRESVSYNKLFMTLLTKGAISCHRNYKSNIYFTRWRRKKNGC